MAAPDPFPPEAAFRLLNQSREVFVIADATGVLRYVSPSAANLFGFKNVDVLGKPATLFIHGEDHGALGALCADAVAHTTSSGTTRLRHRTVAAGQFVPMDCKACFDGEFIFLVMLDASEATRFEESLRVSLSTSHDLRTPVHSIQTCAALLLGDPSCGEDAEATALLRGVQSACEVLTLVICNVLALGRLDAPPPPSPLRNAAAGPAFDPRGPITAAARLICGARVAWAGGGDAGGALAALPARVCGDEALVGRCVANTLLTLARMLAWAHPEATLQLDASAADAAGDDGALLLRLRARAPGCALGAEECAALIAPFGVTPTDRGNVTGLPLFLARRAARATGGDLTLDCSELGIEASLSLHLHRPRDEDGTCDTASTRAANTAAAAAPPPAHAAAAASPPASPAALPPRMTEMEVSRRLFSFLVRNSDDLFLIVQLHPAAEDAGGVETSIVYASPNTARVLDLRGGADAAAGSGLPLSALLAAEDAPRASRALEDALAAAAASPGWLTHVACSVRATGPRSPWLDVSGVVDGGTAYLVLRDASARKATEEALRRFSVATTHQLREPCAAILLGVALLEHRPCIHASAAAAAAARREDPLACAAGDARFLLTAIRAACSLLLGIMANVLSARALESGELALQTEPFSVSSLVADVLQAIQLAGGGSMAAAASRFVWERPPGADALPQLVEGDRQRIGQVLMNLCNNAMKWGGGRPVRVRCHLKWRQQLVLSVSDEGCGLTPEAAAAAASGRGDGGGLGLFVSRTLAELMRGSLTFSTAPGRGASFTLAVPVRVLDAREAGQVRAEAVAAATAARYELGDASDAEEADACSSVATMAGTQAPNKAAPAAAAAPAITTGTTGAAAASTAAAPRHRALVADDHALNLRVVTRLLATHGFDVTPVPDGRTALDALLAAMRGDAPPFDVAVLDVQMPLMDGPSAAAEFRREERACRGGHMQLPIIALSAAVEEEGAAVCAAAGMDSFIAKPLAAEGIAMLRAAAAEYAETRRMEEQPAPKRAKRG